MKRLEIFEAFGAAAVVVAGGEYAEDETIERVWTGWNAKGAPHGVTILIENGTDGVRAGRIRISRPS